MDTTERVAGNIRAEMARRRFSQQALAIHLGLSQAAVSNRLNGRTPFRLDEIASIAGLLGVTVVSLVTEPAELAS